jgi:type IV pilus assembly protein PilQ
MEVVMNIKAFSYLRTPLLLVFSSMVALAGCASPKTVVKEPPQPPPAVAEAQQVEVEVEMREGTMLEMISVVGTGDAIFIETDGSVKYTAFRLSDPPRLVVDLPGVDVTKVTAPIKVDNNFLTVITTSSYGENSERIGRVEIGLREGITHKVKSGENSILVDLARDIYISGESAPETQMVAEAAAAGKETLIEEVLMEGEEGVHTEEVPVPDRGSRARGRTGARRA